MQVMLSQPVPSFSVLLAMHTSHSWMEREKHCIFAGDSRLLKAFLPEISRLLKAFGRGISLLI